MDKIAAVNTLLCGPKGLFLTERAERIARFLLRTDNLQVHPDFLRIKSDRPLGVEEAEQILLKGNTVPCAAEYTVVIVEDLDTMTVPAQNKLLKLVEDENHVILIGTSCYDGVLPTLRSRMHCVDYSPYSRRAFSDYLVQQGIEDEDVLFYVTGGCPGLLGQNVVMELADIFRLVAEAIRNEQPLFSTLGLVKEKDSTCFFKMYREYLPELYSFIGQKLMESRGYSPGLSAKISAVQEHLMICREPYYTMDCFFEAVAKISKKEEP